MNSNSSAGNSEVTLRPATAADAAACGPICYAAFATLNAAHGFPCDLPSPEAAVGLLTMMFSHPSFFCVVAEVEGRVVGSNCLDERSIIHGVGPITIDPGAQNKGIGHFLMQAVMERAQQKGAAGVRLVQAAFHNRSLSLYASLGFDVREPLSCVQGVCTAPAVLGSLVRPAGLDDRAACNALSAEIHGFERSQELTEAIQQGTARVVERNGHIAGYTTHLGFFGHSTAETHEDLQALIAAADCLAGPGILVPSRGTALLRWCLSHGLRVVQPMTLMSTGLFQQPLGAWLPSIVF